MSSWDPTGTTLTPRWFGRNRRFEIVAQSPGIARAVFSLDAGEETQVRFTDLRISGSSPPTQRSGLETPAGRRPRLVVVYVMDALRADYVGHLGGDPAATPTWDRLASEGWTATQHRSVAPNTMPSSKALFTGRIFATGGGSMLKPADGPTLAERFREAGYRTGLFSGNVHLSDAYGMDRGFEVAPKESLFDRHYVVGKTAHNDNAERVQRAALDWLVSLPADADAFVYLHTIHPHSPYAPPRNERERFAPRAARLGIDGEMKTLFRIKQGHREISEAEKEALRGLYRGSLAYNDRLLADFLGALAERFSPADTVLALTSDHGEELFDHGGVLHGYTLYEEKLRIPLVLWGPGRFAPRRIERPTDTLDLHRALSSIAGGSPVDNAPLRTELQLAAASSLKGGFYSIQNSRWKIVWAPRRPPGWGMGDGIGRGRDAELWFGLDRDPREVRQPRRGRRMGSGVAAGATLCVDRKGNRRESRLRQRFPGERARDGSRNCQGPARPGLPAMTRIRLAATAIGLVAFAWLAFGPFATTHPLPARAAAMVALMAIWWITEALPIHWTACVPLVVFPAFGVFGSGFAANLGGAVAPYVDPYIFLFAGGMAIAAAMQQWGLHRRIALAVMATVGTRRRASSSVFSPPLPSFRLWISNTATAAMMLPIGLAVIAQLETRRRPAPAALRHGDHAGDRLRLERRRHRHQDRHGAQRAVLRLHGTRRSGDLLLQFMSSASPSSSSSCRSSGGAVARWPHGTLARRSGPAR